jgi:hypothetical protein
MAKFRCVCGQQIRTGGDTANPIEWRLLSDVEFEFSGFLERNEIYRRSTLVYRCPASDHLYVFWSGMDNAPTLYSQTPLPRRRWGLRIRLVRS